MNTVRNSPFLRSCCQLISPIASEKFHHSLAVTEILGCNDARYVTDIPNFSYKNTTFFFFQATTSIIRNTSNHITQHSKLNSLIYTISETIQENSDAEPTQLNSDSMSNPADGDTEGSSPAVGDAKDSSPDLEILSSCDTSSKPSPALIILWHKVVTRTW